MYYSDRIEDELNKRVGAMEDMRREVDRGMERHIEVMNKEWELYRLAIGQEMNKHNSQVKRITEKYLGSVDIHEAALRKLTKEVLDRGGELQIKDTGARSSGSNRWLDVGLDDMIKATREIGERTEEYRVAEIGPWYRVPGDYEPTRAGETYIPRFERKTIKVEGDNVEIVEGAKGHRNPGLGYEAGEEPRQWPFLWYDPKELVIENEIIEDKKDLRGATNAYNPEVKPEARTWEHKDDEGDFERPVWTRFSGQEVQISAFNYSGRVTMQEEGDGAIYCLCPSGTVSCVAARVSGFATQGRHSASRMRLVDLMEKLADDKVVAFHVPIGISSKENRQLAYAGLGFVQFATHEGLCRALERQIYIGEKAIVVDKCSKEFAVERLMGTLQSFRGPRCVVSGREDERTSMWKSKLNYWRSDPFEWSYRLDKMLKDPAVSER